MDTNRSSRQTYLLIISQTLGAFILWLVLLVLFWAVSKSFGASYDYFPTDPEVGIPSLLSEGRTAIKRVLNSLDRVAFLTQSGWIDGELVMPWMNPMIVKSWVKI